MTSLRTAIADRAHELGLSAFDLARLVRDRNGAWVVSTDHCTRYLTGEKDMTSEKVNHLLDALGIELRVPDEDTRGNQ